LADVRFVLFLLLSVVGASVSIGNTGYLAYGIAL
jgi:hypothetical protein